jgi:hypothetical protein
MPVTLKAINDGTLYDIPDAERDEALATGKFTENYRVKAKNDGTEYVIPADEITDAMKTGKFEFSNVYDQRKQIEANPTKPKISGVDALAAGALNSATLGFGDEIYGGLKGLKDAATTDKSFSDSYAENRDKMRQFNDLAQDQNPWWYGGGSLLGGAVIPLGAASGAKTLVGGVLKGGASGAGAGFLQGIGDNVRPEDLVGDVAKGTIIGGGLGAVAGGVGRVAPAAIEGGRDVLSKGASKVGLDKLSAFLEPGTNAARQSVTGEIGAFKQGMKESNTDFVIGYNQAKKIWDGFKETLKTVDAQKELFDFVNGSKQNTMKALSRMVEDGSIPQDQAKAYLSFMNNLSDDEYIITKLNDGDADVAGWIARQAGGNTEAKAKFLAMAPGERQALRSADFTQEAKDLSPLVDPAKDAIFKDAGSKFGTARADAAKNFDPTIGRVIDAQDKAAQNFANMGEVAGGGTRSYFNQAQKIIMDGVGDLDKRFSKGMGYGEVGAVEQYDRLKAARELLDAGINWSASKNQSPIGEKFLKDYRAAIDGALKELPSQVEADKAYSIASNLDDMIFKNMELGGNVDPYKLKRAFGNTDNANRLRDGLNQLEDFANNAKDPDVREKSQAFLEKFNKIFEKKQDSDALNQLQREGGPSALAIQNLQRSMRGKDGTVLQEAINETPAFMIRQESRAADMQKAIGKAYKDMTLPEKAAFNKVYIGIQKQGNVATPEAIKHNFGLELEKANKIK